MTHTAPDPVQEFIDRRNRERAARPNPLLPKATKPEQNVAGEDAVSRFIRCRNAAAAARPTLLSK